MSETQTITQTQSINVPATLVLKNPVKAEDDYRYAHLLPHFSQDRYPPLEPFEHVDPGHRALSHPNPRAFLQNATVTSVIELTPRLGTEGAFHSTRHVEETHLTQSAALILRN